MLGLGTPELLIILGIILFIFGATLLPKLARSMGRTSKEFKEGIRSVTARHEERCPFCGSEVTSDLKFCAGCGRSKQDIANERERLRSA